MASAPGKAILFGEHAVVHGITAVAAALSDLRIAVKMVHSLNLCQCILQLSRV